ncbi:MAG: hypothetical protein AB7P18_05785 [Candidatus Binatia bacterium]
MLSSSKPQASTSDKRIESDEYVLAYIFGAATFILYVFEVEDTIEKNIILTEVWKQLFPDSWDEVVSLCHDRLETCEPHFLGVFLNAFLEMKNSLETFVVSGQHQGFVSLQQYIAQHYA